MTDITLRAVKGSPLTHDEVDANFTNLQTTADAAASDGAQALNTKANATALGVLADDADMGTFTGTTIADNATAKEALQSLETAVESASGSAATKANASAVGVSASDSDMGTYTGSTIPDSETAKQNLQSLETAVEARAVSATLAATGGSALIGDDDGASGSLWSTVAGFITYLRSSVGSSIVGFIQAGTGATARTVQAKMRETVSALDFGAVGDGVTDDTTAVQAAIDYLESIGGGTLLFTGNFLVGGLTITNRDIELVGRSRLDRLTIKNGTTGITWSENWSSIRHLSIISQGTEGDGLGTSGVLHSKGVSGQSSGHLIIDDVSFIGFSGYGLKLVNTLDTSIRSSFFQNCVTGIHIARGGTGGADFSTTTFIHDVYLSSCTTGIDADYVYRSSFNVIAEYCDIGINGNIGDFDTVRCYFENNTTLGAQLVDCAGQDFGNYSNNATTDAVTRTRSAIANTDWFTSAMYTSGTSKGDYHAKRLGVQTLWGRDTTYLAGVGTTDVVGLKFDEAIIPRVYGDDLLDQKAWASWTTSEFAGWSVANKGYSITTALTGVRGMKQSVTLDSTKTYVIDQTVRNVSGNAASIISVDGTARTVGVPFTVASTGSKVVGCYNSQTVASENYVEVFRLMEVLEDQTLIAQTTDILSRKPVQREQIYASSAPVSGTWGVGEIVWNSAPAAAGTIGWVCTTAGSPGTWKSWGTIAA